MAASSLSAFAATLGASSLAVVEASRPDEPVRRGSRRRRLWELDGCAHCPVIGVCLPIGALRRLFEKVGVRDVAADDYALHCDAMGACKRRSPLAEALQRELDHRFVKALRLSDRMKTTDELTAWWQTMHRGCDLPGAVWATMTHARCDTDLQHRVLGDVHMLQHQVGSAERVERGRLEVALDELGEWRAMVAQLQERLQRQAADHARQHARQQAERVELRAALARREMTIATMRCEIEQTGGAVAHPAPSTPSIDERQEQRERIASLRRALMHARSELVRARQRLPRDAARYNEPARDGIDANALQAMSSTSAVVPGPVLDERAVLCVGGRPASVPLYRRIVERSGGRFIHHDGGDQQNVTRLDVSLAAADLVICQTGCISHDAYWRVKDHCKRTGKPCVFVENPSSTSLKRAVAGLQAAEAS